MSDATKADLEALRRLAEEGRSAPLAGGRYLAAFASLSAVGLVGLYWLIESRAPGWTALALWGGLMAVGAGLFTLFNRQTADLPGAHTAVGKAEGMVWSYGGFAIFAFALAYVLRLAMGIETPPLMGGLIGTVAFLAYGIAFLTSAGLSQQKWLLWPGYGAFVSAVIVALIAQDTLVLLVTAGLIVVVGTLPGLMLMRAERAGAAGGRV